MHSPVAAMLWENWRLTRVEAAQRLAQGTVLTAAVLAGVAALGTAGNTAARLALGLLVMTYAPIWIAVARLNGGRFMDGYRPGYPYHFLYARPVRTALLVAAPMACLVASSVAGYVVAALVLRAAFGYAFPLWPLAAWIAAFHVTQWAVQWGTSNKVVQWVGSLASGGGFAALAIWRAQEWPTRTDFSLGYYTALIAVSAASFGLAVAGVGRQRRGDARAALPRTVEWRGFSDWLAGLFRFPCPTSSPTRAQVWFDLKSSGLAVLAIGLAFATLIPLLFVVTTRLDLMLSAHIAQPVTRMFAVVVAIFSLPAVLLHGGNALGIRARQGRTYASAFEATQACGTARMAALKVLGRSACLMTALLAVGASVWISASVIPFDVLEDNDTFIEKSRTPLSAWMRALRAGVSSMSAHELLALAWVAFVAVAGIVAVRASLTALGARYPRRMNIARSAVLAHGLLLVLLALGAQRGMVSQAVADTMLTATKWTAVTALVLATVYLLGASLSERLLTPRSAGVVLVSWAAFAAAWGTLLRAEGVQVGLRLLAGVQPGELRASYFTCVLVVMLVSLLVPWSLSRVRHT